MITALLMAITIAYRPAVMATGPEVRLADIADLSALNPALRNRAAVLVVARRGRDQQTAVLDGRRIAERARAQLPALADRLPESGEVLVRWTPDAPTALPASNACAKVVIPIEGGAFPATEDLAPATCPAGFRSNRDLILDPAAGLVRASRDLAPGQMVAAPPAAMLARYRKGQAFDLSIVVGPVKVERSVEAVRPVRPGANAVVRAADSAVLFVPGPREESR